jgi:protein-disulfide isomerase
MIVGTRHSALNGGIMVFRLWLLALCVACGLLPGGQAWAGESRQSASRDDVVLALERGPGPSRGFPSARLTVVELSDFQCSYCRKFRWETLPQLEERYIRAGKIRFVYRHMAVLGPASVQAAQAASCAEDQGRFWEYHDKLFEQRGALAFSGSRLKTYASDLGLDTDGFAQCLDSKRHAGRVETETLLGRMLGATGSPTFLVNGQLMIGAYPYAVFERTLNEMLK